MSAVYLDDVLDAGEVILTDGAYEAVRLPRTQLIAEKIISYYVRGKDTGLIEYLASNCIDVIRACRGLAAAAKEQANESKAEGAGIVIARQVPDMPVR